MNVALSFVPFIIFAIVNGAINLAAALAVSAVISAALIVRTVVGSASPKILEIGSLVLFGGLWLFVEVSATSISLPAVRLTVDMGLLLVVLASMGVGRPFTIQYAKEQVPREYWNRPRFRRVNYVITSVWAASFGVTAIADFARTYAPARTGTLDTLIVVGSTIGAIKFTKWYPAWVRSNARSSGPEDLTNAVKRR